MQLKKAQRKQVKLRLNLSAPSGAGKTYSALLLAKGLVGNWGKIAVIDTENGSASLYDHLGEFNVIDLQPPFSPERYIEAINACTAAGIECIIIDSSTHEWSGAGGCLEINEKLAAAKYKGNTWSAWSETTPKHERFVNHVLHCDAHVITCTRSKMETVMGEDRKVKKVGMKDMQRDGWEYESTVSLSIDRDTHMVIASKDRTELFEGKEPFVITEATGTMIRKWCETGEAPEKQLSVMEYIANINAVDDIDNPERKEEERNALEEAKLKAVRDFNVCKSIVEVTALWNKLPAHVRAIPEVIEACKVKGESFKVAKPATNETTK